MSMPAVRVNHAVYRAGMETYQVRALIWASLGMDQAGRPQDEQPCVGRRRGVVGFQHS
jgi:hypothetical protein